MALNKITKTYREIVTFLNIASALQNTNPPKSKFEYATGRTLKIALKAHEECEALLSEANIDHCSSDEKGNILTNAREGLVFTKEAIFLRNRAHRTIMDTAVPLEVYWATAMPAKPLTSEQTAAFAGFLFAEPTEPVTDPDLTSSAV